MGVETLPLIEQDLPERDELRLILPADRLANIQALLSGDFEPKIFSGRKINRTVYFNNSEHEVPWGVSLKARQYYPDRSLAGCQVLDPSDIYLIEIKEQTIGLRRTKKRYQMPLGQAGSFFISSVSLPPFTQPIRPFVADEYERFHFTPKDKGKERITLDLNPSYFFIDEKGLLIKVGKETSVRIELKTSGPFSDNLTRFLSELKRLGAYRTVSKKVAAYSLEGRHYDRKANSAPIRKELKNLEIESKLEVVDPNAFYLFSQIVQEFRRGVDRFEIPTSYPHVVESASINSYYLPEVNDDSEGVKLLARPTIAKSVSKSEFKAVPDPYGLNCIVRRKEVKGKYFPLEEVEKVLEREEGKTGNQLELAGELERLRKAFWVRNKETERIYHISIDRSQLGDRKFYQIEVEYTGVSGEKDQNAEQLVIKDIADLTRQIILLHPNSVIPSVQRKLDWLTLDPK